MSFRYLFWRAPFTGRQRSTPNSGRRTVPLEITGAACHPAPVRQSIPALLSVSVPSGCHLRMVQPVQSRADTLEKGILHPLHGLQTGMPSGSGPGRNLRVTRMHPMRRMYKNTSGKLRTFLRQATVKHRKSQIHLDILHIFIYTEIRTIKSEA